MLITRCGITPFKRSQRQRVAAELNSLHQGTRPLADYIADAKDLHLHISREQEQTLADNFVTPGSLIIFEAGPQKTKSRPVVRNGNGGENSRSSEKI
jgi:hypothetical protein